MTPVRLLDSTLGDGGYVNSWHFGKRAITDTIQGLESAHVDIVEVGVLRDEPYSNDRAVFNTTEQIKALITPKKDGTLYAVMVEASDEFPIDLIPVADKDGVDIIRVIVWKTKQDRDCVVKNTLREGFDYCKEIVDKGYKISVMPACVDQYSDKEFLEMIDLFSKLDPLAIYIVDSWGTQSAEMLMRYMKLTDVHMKKGISIGYHGHNNLMQAFGAAAKMIAYEFAHDLIIDASIYGIGYGAGNLHTEVITKYLNEETGSLYSINPLLDVYSRFIRFVYWVRAWGYNISYYLAANNRCDPEYADYYGMELRLEVDELSGVLQSLDEKDKESFSKKKAKLALESYKRSFWEKRLCVIVPTANKPEDIEYYLKTVGRIFAKHGIDLIIYDSSKDSKVENVVRKHIKDGSSTTRYERYNGIYNGRAIDEKVVAAYSEHMDKYEYIWVCRDGWVVNPDVITPALLGLTRRYDTIILSSVFEDINAIGYKEYTDCRELFKEQCAHTTILGTMIFSSQFIRKVIDEVQVDEIKNRGLWLPIAIFEYYSHVYPSISAVHITVDAVITNAHATAISFWNKNGGALWQWGERWYKMVTMLPGIYNEHKRDVLKIQMADFTPFAMKQLVIMRSSGSLSWKLLTQYGAYIPHVTDQKKSRMQLISVIPKSLCKTIVQKERSVISRGARSIYRLIKKINGYIQPRPVFKVLPPLKKMLEKNPENKELCFEPKQICMIIPTYNRADVLSEVFTFVLQYYHNYGIDVIVFDSSDTQDTEDLIKKKNHEGFKNVYYKRFIGKADLDSLDSKVNAAYRACCDEYEYVWAVRDRLAVQLNNCAYYIKKAIREKIDAISIHNTGDDYYHVGTAEYRDISLFFKQQFVPMSVLGQSIFRSESLKRILETVPIDPVKNYGLWTPVAFFEYYADRPCKIMSISESIFLAHDSVSKGSFWMRNLLWQWVERFYWILHSLPSCYSSESKKAIVYEWNNKYHLLDAGYLLACRINDGLTSAKIRVCEEYIPYLTETPVKVFYEIARMSKTKARHIQSHPTKKKWVHIFQKDSNSEIYGKIE